jgi:SAM-dependent methyltransferase
MRAINEIELSDPLELTEFVLSCPCCGSLDRIPVLERARDLLTSSPAAAFGIWKCTGCSSAYLSPRPKEQHLGRYYPDDEYLPVDKGYARPTGWMQDVKYYLRLVLGLPYIIRFGALEPTVSPFGAGRLLEIGFGHGVYLAEMHRLGWDVSGCDISESKVERLQAKFGEDRIFLGSLDEIPVEPESFDLIALWHVIEHLHDPGPMLDRIRTLLKPGGRLTIGTPTYPCLESKFFRKWWIGFEVPRHLIVFSQPALVQMLIEHGFKIAHVRPSIWSYSVPDSVALFFKDRLGINIWGGRLHRWIHHLLFPVVALSRALGNWAILEITAQKL